MRGLLALTAIFAFPALAIAGQEGPDMTAARLYGRCLAAAGMTLEPAVTSLDEVIKSALDKCGPERATTVAAVRAVMISKGLKSDEADALAEEFIHSDELEVTGELKVALTKIRETRQRSDAKN